MNEKNKIIENIELNKFEKNLFLLPDDLKKHIYKLFFEPTLLAYEIVNNFLEKLESKKSIVLDISDILPLIEIILNNNLCIQKLYYSYFIIDPYTKFKINYFKILYDKIIKNNKRNFILLNKKEDLALSG